MEEISAVLQKHRADSAALAEAYAAVPKEALDEPAAADQPTDTAQSADTLREFILLALRENPAIKAAESLARAQAQRVAQVTSLPDPMITTKTLPEPVRTAEGDNFFILGISQKVIIPEKLDRAGKIAMEEARAALEALQETRLEVIADVKRAYFQWYVIEKSIEVTTQNRELLSGLIDVARAQVASGRRSQSDVLRAQVELSNLEAELIGLRQRRATLQARLGELTNHASDVSAVAPSDVDLRSTTLTLEKLLVAAAEANPTLGRLERVIKRDREAVELARLAYIPEFTIGVEWMQMDPRGAFEPPRNPMTGLRPPSPQLSEDGSDNWAITLGFNLPIWTDRIKAGILESRERLAASEQSLAATRNRIHFQVEDAWERVQAQQQLARLFNDTIIPQAEQAYRVSQASYSTGTIDFLDVIDNWRTWLTFMIHYHRSLGALEESVADLEQAVGLSMTELGDSG